MLDTNPGPRQNETTRSTQRPLRLGIAWQIRLVSAAAFAVAIVGAWGYIAFVDDEGPEYEVGDIEAAFWEASLLVASLRKQPEHVEQVRTWLEAHYPRSPFVIVDETYELLAESDPPPPPEHYDEYAHYSWEFALVLPFDDAQGRRFYASVLHDRQYELSPWVVHIEFILPLFFLLVFLVATMALARRVTRPMRQMSAAAEAITAGALAQRTGVTRSDEIGDLARAFDAMADRNAELLLAQKHLLAQVGHELRTPLARVRVALDIARERVPDTDGTPLADVDVDLEEMARLISDILAVSRLETADVQGTLAETLRIEELSFATLTKETAARFGATHPDRVLSGAAIEPGELLGDRVLLGRVLWNLLENAHKHAPPGTSITLRADIDGPYAVWVIEDAGSGIDPELLVRVFEPFFQGRSSGASTMGGFGLGLSLCKRVVDAHGGSITLENQREGGLRVRVMLPLAPSTEALL